MLDYRQLFSQLTITEAESYLLKEHCPELLAVKYDDISTVDARKETVEQITECFFNQYQQYPKQSILAKLSDYLLLDYIKYANKKSCEDNQFLTDTQQRYRKKREQIMQQEHLEHFHAKQQWRLAFKKNTQEKEQC